MTSTQRSDAELAVDAVRAGMDVIRATSGEAAGRIPKGGDDFATAADIHAEHAIRSVLRAGRPDDAIEGEELGRSGDLGRSARLWRVDPLCGTRNFASGAGDYCTNVALCLSGTPVVSAVGDPRRHVVYWTDGVRAGALTDGGDLPLRPDAHNRIVELNADEPWDVVTSRLLADRGLREAMTPRVSATTLALAWVAAGHRAAYVNDGDLRESVHFAAGIALCRGAGCVVTDLHGDGLDSGLGLLVTADARVHDELRHHIRSVLGHADPPPR
ncbi:inositol monophosphatase family protein [Pseudonocardia sp. KRD291]|uniref:inositol monophosphatase family protein n=1 Tax=Pseudonocardia sp. KRD291 TaxID=2792007 RepID=UPI001C4A1E61|nr:inositol monophosphatase family protein [Pseudonocardia sp. KRD291]MBW0102260.1 phosphatase [Pseudonocardia sp. KRD291]